MFPCSQGAHIALGMRVEKKDEIMLMMLAEFGFLTADIETDETEPPFRANLMMVDDDTYLVNDAPMPSTEFAAAWVIQLVNAMYPDL